MATVTKAANSWAGASISPAWGGTGTITNPTNAYSLTTDSVYATLPASATRSSTVAAGFAFPAFTASDIPDGATITAVRVIVTWGMSAAVTGGLLRGRITLAADGTIYSSESTKTGTAQATTTLTANLALPTVTDLRTGGITSGLEFQFRAEKGNTTSVYNAQIDRVYVEVDYTAVVDTLVTPGSRSLTTSASAPTVSVTNNQRLVPSARALTLTASAPSVSRTANVVVVPSALALTTSRSAPTVTASDAKLVTPSAASLTLTASAPSIALSDNTSVTPAAASLILTAGAPTVGATAHVNVVPGAPSLSLSVGTPEVAATAHLTVTPAAAGLTTTADVPAVSTTAHVTVVPAAAAIALAFAAPAVSTGDAVAVVPGAGSLTLTLGAPTVTFTANRLVAPLAVGLVLSGAAPTVTATASVSVIPVATALTLTAGAPIALGGAGEVVPGPAALVITTYRPSIHVLFRGMRAEIQSAGVGAALVSSGSVSGSTSASPTLSGGIESRP